MVNTVLFPKVCCLHIANIQDSCHPQKYLHFLIAYIIFRSIFPEIISFNTNDRILRNHQ